MTVTAPSRPDTRTNGHGPPVRLSGPRSRRIPWVVLSVVLVAVGALLAGLLVQSAGDRVAVLVAARDIAPGQTVGEGDVRVVEVAVDGTASVVRADRRGEVVGKTATGRIPAGALLASGQFTGDALLRAGTVVVGALLGPGELPVPGLRPGDEVALYAVSGPQGTARPSDAGTAVVYATAPTAQQGSLFVSLVVDADDAREVTDIASQGRLRLVLLAAEDSRGR